MYVLEDNDAVISICIQGRSPALRHVARTQRVDLDWSFQRLREDFVIHMRCIHASEQIADILKKGQFSAVQWSVLTKLSQLGTPIVIV